MLIQCPECKNMISDKANICPKCGYPIDSINLNDNENVIIPELSSNAFVFQNDGIKPKWKLGRKIIGILSIVLFFVISLQSCATGIYDTISDSGGVGGIAGFISAILVLTAGIINISTINDIKKNGIAWGLSFYWMAAFISKIGCKSFPDLKMWSLISFIFGFVNLISIKNNKKDIIGSCFISAFFIIYIIYC